jgi:hypothetical protein
MDSSHEDRKKGGELLHPLLSIPLRKSYFFFEAFAAFFFFFAILSPPLSSIVSLGRMTRAAC